MNLFTLSLQRRTPAIVCLGAVIAIGCVAPTGSSAQSTCLSLSAGNGSRSAGAITAGDVTSEALANPTAPPTSHRAGYRSVGSSEALADPAARPAPNAAPAVKHTEHWIPLPMLSGKLAAAGITPGGEGCQYPQTIAIDAKDGSFILFGTDVGGIYRSIDGGRTFSPCDMGYAAVGSCGFAIDPRNPNRCLSVGDNTGNAWYRYDGIYFSSDRAASWKQVLPKLNRGSEKGREQIAYDPASFDPKLKYCATAYWEEEGNEEEPGGRLYRSDDGGVNWKQICDGTAFGGGKLTSILKLDPKSGAVYIANDSGFYKSTDRGATFVRKQQGNFTSLDTVASEPNSIYATTNSTLWISRDGGETFQTTKTAGIDAFYRLKVSPADPKRMICQNPKDQERYYSADSGATWTKCGKEMSKSYFSADILYNDRARLVVWHPKNPELAWGIGPGDIITKTANHGKTFQWANNGNNGIMTGGLINFNTQNPDVLYIGSQDYNGALTVNGGKIWEFVNLSKNNILKSGRDDGDAWGWVYGGYAASDKIIFGGNRAYTEDNFNLWETFDGGKTTKQGYENLTGAQVSYGDPTDADVLFCWSVRSVDRGQTWAKMNGCDGVFTSNSRGARELYGRNGKDVVTSGDKGATWQVLATMSDNVRDIACDPLHHRLYVVAGNSRLYQLDSPDYKLTDIHDRVPHDQHGDMFFASSVATDPVNPNVVYLAANGTGLFFQHDNGVARSCDGGKTWEKLTCNPDYCLNGVTGGQMASAIRVHPITRFAYTGSDCYGVWKIGPPPDGAE